MSILAAIAGPAVGSVVSGIFGNKAAKKANSLNQQALDLQREQLNYTKSINQPYQDAGVNALNRLDRMTPEQVLESDPGYAFRLAEGNRALNSSLLARGQGLSGNQIRAGIGYNQGMASQEYGNAFNRLMGIAGLGAGANNSAIAGTGYATNAMSNIYGNMGQNVMEGANSTINAIRNISGIASAALPYLQKPQETFMDFQAPYRGIPPTNNSFLTPNPALYTG